MDREILERLEKLAGENDWRGCDCFAYEDALQLIFEVRRLRQIARAYDVNLDFCLRCLEDEGVPMPETRKARAFLRQEAGIEDA